MKRSSPAFGKLPIPILPAHWSLAAPNVDTHRHQLGELLSGLPSSFLYRREGQAC